MYKGKVGYWVTIISIVLVIQFCLSIVFPWMGSWFDTKVVTINAECMGDTLFLEKVGNRSSDDLEFKVEKSNPDVFISDNPDLTTKDGYKKLENYLYSPIVMYMRNDAITNPEGLTRINPGDDTRSPLQIDLYNILEGIETGAEWKSLGISSKIVKGTVNVVIPNERSSYYPEIEELFYFTLNNYNPLTEEDYTRLAPRVNKILSKCEKISDVSQGIVKEHDKHSENYKVFIGPEYLYHRGGSEMNRENSGAYIPVYFMNTVCMEMDMYLKSNYADGEENVAEWFNEYILENISFYSLSSWRVKDSFFSMSYINSALPETIPGYIG